MREKKTRKLSRAFKYFIAGYLALVICIVAPVSWILSMMRSTSLSDAARIVGLELNSCGKEIDAMFASVTDASYQFGRNTELKKAQSVAGLHNGETAYDLYSAMIEFRNLTPISHNFKYALFYCPTNDIVITTESVFPSFEQFCRTYLDDIDPGKLKAAFTNQHSTNGSVCFGNIFFIFSNVYSENLLGTKAICCFGISKNEMNAAMRGSYPDAGYALVNLAGDILMASIPDSMHAELRRLLSTQTENTFFATLAGEKVLISTRFSQNGNLTYVSMLPVSSVTSRIDSVTQILYIGVLLITLLALGVGVLLSMKNTRLIRRFASEIDPDAHSHKDEFVAIESGIRTLHNQNRHYQELLARQRTSLETAFFVRLYMGAFISDVDLIASMNEAGLAITGGFFTVSILVAPEESPGAQLAINDAFDDETYIQPLKENMYTVLTIADAQDADANDIAMRFPNDVRIFTGNTVSSLKDIYESYQTALDRLTADKCSNRCEYEEEEKPSDELEIRIRMYIMEHYLDPELSLSRLAQALDMSEPYISSYFKKRTGKNISSYIEQLRIDKAYSLLMETDHPIKEIVEMCGYQNDQTFRRAFKKLKGCTPGQVRAEE